MAERQTGPNLHRSVWGPIVTVVLLGVAAGVVSPRIAAAQGDISTLAEDARQRLLLQLKAGNEAFDRGAYDEALLRYDTAAGIAELASIHYRRGLCLEKLERYPEAIASYKRFLELDPSAPESGRVRTDIVRFEAIVARQSVGRLSVNTVPADAEVRLDAADAAVLGKTPLFEITTEPGSHTLYISKAGFESRTERVEITPGQAVSVQYQLQVKVAAEGIVSFSSQPPGATVRLGGADGPVLGKTPLTTKVDAGPATFHVSTPGYKPRAESYQIAAGQRLAVDYSLEKEVSDVGLGPNGWKGGPKPGRRDQGVSGAGIGLTVTGAVLGIGAAGMWFLAESTIKDANDYDRQAPGHTRDALTDMEANVPLYKVGTWVAAGLGGASLLTGIILLVTSSDDDAPAASGWSLELGPAGARVGYELEF